MDSRKDSNSSDSTIRIFLKQNTKEINKHVAYFVERIEITEDTIRIRGEDLKYYAIVEAELMKYLKLQQLLPEERKFYKILLRDTLYEKFIEVRTDSRKKLEKSIHELFYQFLDNFLTDTTDLNKYFGTEINYSNIHVESNDTTRLNTTLKIMETGVFNACKYYISSYLPEAQMIPVFLLFNEKKLIKQRVDRIWKINYEIPVNNLKLQSEFGYEFLSAQFLDFVNEKVNVFDEKYYDEETLLTIFDIFLYSNLEYLQNDSNLSAFLNNTQKYIFLMGLKKHNNTLVMKIGEKLTEFKSEANNISKTIHQLMLQLQEKFGDGFDYLKFRGYLQSKIENATSHCEKFLFLIFSLSIMLNNLAKTNVEIDDNGEITCKAVFTSQLKCSSRERQFLLNVLNKFDWFISSLDSDEQDDESEKANPRIIPALCMHINYILENSIFGNLIKSYTKILFDEDNKAKIVLDYDIILEQLRKVGFGSSNATNELSHDYVFNTLDDFDCNVFSNLFSKFYSLYIHNEDETEKNQVPEGLVNKMTFGLKSIFQKIIPKKTEKLFNFEKFDPSRVKLIPHDPINISTHICICVNGMFIPEQYEHGVKQENMWQNITIENKGVDYYYYNWQDYLNFYKSNTVKEMFMYLKSTVTGEDQKTYEEICDSNLKKMVTHNKKISKFFGKFLAYIIASRAVFKFHSISLIGYSLGCNVIKHCLMELRKLSESMDVNEVIHNIIFIAGATKFNEKKMSLTDTFKTVSGRVINCYSIHDTKLNRMYSTNSIGLKHLQGETLFPKIENYDFSYMKMDHDDYKADLEKILNKIKIY